MEPGLLRTFDSYERATEARDALLAAGLQDSQLKLEATGDEAGPVEGNFLVGNGRDDDENLDEPLPSGADPIYQRNFKRTVHRGLYRLTVEVRDAAERNSAGELLARFGGVDPDPLSAGKQPG